jgi:hypothetical protein
MKTISLSFKHDEENLSHACLANGKEMIPTSECRKPSMLEIMAAKSLVDNIVDKHTEEGISYEILAKELLNATPKDGADLARFMFICGVVMAEDHVEHRLLVLKQLIGEKGPHKTSEFAEDVYKRVIASRLRERKAIGNPEEEVVQEATTLASTVALLAMASASVCHQHQAEDFLALMMQEMMGNPEHEEIKKQLKDTRGPKRLPRDTFPN